MMTKCTCNSCSTILEFEEEHAGETIVCPHCGAETTLFFPDTTITRPPVFPPKLSHAIITTTGNDVAGRRITDYLGVVRGIVVRSPNLVQGMFGGLKQIVGGNIESYANVCEQARGQAFDRMVAHAMELKADAIIAIRYDATEFAESVTEVLAYGTAVKLAEVS
jgi:uncharacterized protein YbjQ (UPF0145 family)